MTTQQYSLPSPRLPRLFSAMLALGALAMAASGCGTLPITPDPGIKDCPSGNECDQGYTCLANHRCARFLLSTCTDAAPGSCPPFTAGQACDYHYSAVTPCQAGATDCTGGCAFCDCPPQNPNDPNSPPLADCHADELVWGSCKTQLCALGQLHSCSSCDDDCTRGLNVTAAAGGDATSVVTCVQTAPSQAAGATSAPTYQCQATPGATCQPGYIDADGDLGATPSNGCECNVLAGTCSARGNTACDRAVDAAVLAGTATSAPVGCTVYYRDADGDGRGDPAYSLCLCGPSAEYPTAIGGDCDDTKPQIHPGAPEVCDGVDNNCDGQIDEGQDDPGCQNYYVDRDGDGYGVGEPACLCHATGAYTASKSGDCDDDPAACGAACHPEADEIYDGFDHNCDGQIDPLSIATVGASGYDLDEAQVQRSAYNATLDSRGTPQLTRDNILLAAESIFRGWVSVPSSNPKLYVFANYDHVPEALVKAFGTIAVASTSGVTTGLESAMLEFGTPAFAADFKSAYDNLPVGASKVEVTNMLDALTAISPPAPGAVGDSSSLPYVEQVMGLQALVVVPPPVCAGPGDVNGEGDWTEKGLLDGRYKDAVATATAAGSAAARPLYVKAMASVLTSTETAWAKVFDDTGAYKLTFQSTSQTMLGQALAAAFCMVDTNFARVFTSIGSNGKAFDPDLTTFNTTFRTELAAARARLASNSTPMPGFEPATRLQVLNNLITHLGYLPNALAAEQAANQSLKFVAAINALPTLSP